MDDFESINATSTRHHGTSREVEQREHSALDERNRTKTKEPLATGRQVFRGEELYIHPILHHNVRLGFREELCFE